MKLLVERTNRGTWGAAVGVLFGALALVACQAPELGEGDAVDSTGVCGSGVGLEQGAAGAAGRGEGGTSGTTEPALPIQNCTDGAQCPSGLCVDGVCCDTACDGTCAVQANGRAACKLKSGRICETNAECASGICKTIVVPPDPYDPYDLGYAYTGCE